MILQVPTKKRSTKWVSKISKIATFRITTCILRFGDSEPSSGKYKGSVRNSLWSKFMRGDYYSTRKGGQLNRSRVLEGWVFDRRTGVSIDNLWSPCQISAFTGVFLVVAQISYTKIHIVSSNFYWWSCICWVKKCHFPPAPTAPSCHLRRSIQRRNLTKCANAPI